MSGGLLDVQASGLYVANAGTAAVFSAIQKATGQTILGSGYGYGNVTWTGTSGITSSTVAKASPSTYGVGFAQQSGYTLIETEQLGDVNLQGSVSSSEVGAVHANLSKTGVGWSGGDFYYQGIVTTSDINAALRNKVTGPGAQVRPAVAFGSGASAQVEYDPSSGSLSLVVTGAPDIDNLSVYVDVAGNNLAAQQSLGAGWETQPGITGVLSEYVWDQVNSGQQEANLAAGTYVLAALPAGLSSSDFELAGVPAVAFGASTGVVTTDSVEVVPEPGTLLLLAAAGLAGGGACALRRRKQGNNRQG